MYAEFCGVTLMGQVDFRTSNGCKKIGQIILTHNMYVVDIKYLQLATMMVGMTFCPAHLRVTLLHAADVVTVLLFDVTEVWPPAAQSAQ